MSHISDCIFEHGTALEKDLNGKALWMLSPGNQCKSHTDAGISISRVSTDKTTWERKNLSPEHLSSLQLATYSMYSNPFLVFPCRPQSKKQQDSALKAKTYKVRGFWLCPPGTVSSQLFLQILKNQHSWNWYSSAQRKKKLASTCIIKGRTEADIPERIPLKVGEGRPG